MPKYSPEFEIWWSLMRDWLSGCKPKRRCPDKSGTFKKWKNMNLTSQEVDEIIESTRDQATDFIRALANREFLPQPQDPIRYLRNRRWEDSVVDRDKTQAGATRERMTTEEFEAIVDRATQVATQKGLVLVGSYFYASTVRLAAVDLEREGLELTLDSILERAKEMAARLSD